MITADIAQTVAELEGIAHRSGHMQPFMSMIGKLQQDAAKARITTLKADPNGKSWSPWRPQTLKERTEKGNAHLGLLWDTGTLLNSIDAVSSSAWVAIGTPLDYAADLQDGTHIMDARPFLGWTPESIIETGRLAVLFLQKGLKA